MNASRWRRTAPIVCGLTALALALAGCGGGSSGGTGGAGNGATGNKKVPTSQKDATLAKLVPASVVKNGQIIVAADPSYAPNEFFASDNKTIIGMDPDMGKAIGQVLGVKFTFVKAGFDGIIPGLASGRYGLGMSSFTDNKTREKTVDFVTYLSAGTALMVKKGNPEHLSPSDQSLCGKKVAVEKGTVQESPDIPGRTKKCKAAGKAAVQALVYPDQAGANLALSTGRADGVLADSPVAEYAAKQSSGQFEITGSSYDTAPYGIAVPKTSGTLKDAIKGALDKMIADGTYKKVLDKWGIKEGISTPQINGATS